MRDRPNEHYRSKASAREGRPLSSNEIVHHTNEDKKDDHPDNLAIQTRSAHSSHHGKKEVRNAARIRKILDFETPKLY